VVIHVGGFVARSIMKPRIHALKHHFASDPINKLALELMTRIAYNFSIMLSSAEWPSV
jgi:hypothetical protein